MPRDGRPRFKVKPGARVRKDVAMKVVSECDAMARAGSSITEDSLLDRASDPTNPLHDQFNWDDASAGNEWRRHQARRLLGCVIEFDTRTKKYGRALYNVEITENSAEHQFYARRKYVVKNQTLEDQVSARLYREIVSRCQEAESLGLETVDKAWAKIVASVHRNVPGPAQDRRG